MKKTGVLLKAHYLTLLVDKALTTLRKGEEASAFKEGWRSKDAYIYFNLK